MGRLLWGTLGILLIALLMIFSNPDIYRPTNVYQLLLLYYPAMLLAGVSIAKTFRFGREKTRTGRIINRSIVITFYSLVVLGLLGGLLFYSEW